MKDSPSSEHDVRDPASDDDEPSVPSAASSPSSSAGSPERHPDSGPVLPSITGDEAELGWGDEPGGYSDDWYRSERPPHHG